MDDDAVFAMVADERRELADVLAGLEGDQWSAPSLCEGWAVRDVVGHLLTAFEVSVPAMGVSVLRHRGFGRAMDHHARRLGARPATDLVQRLRDNAEHRFTPPGSGPEAPLTDTIVHGLDIRRPLGIERTIPEERLRLLLDRLADGMKGFVPRERVAGLRFEASDLDWSSGEDATVRGPAEDLLLVITGRLIGLDALEGDGVPTLASRLR